MVCGTGFSWGLLVPFAIMGVGSWGCVGIKLLDRKSLVCNRQ